MVEILLLYMVFGTSIPISKFLLSLAPPIFIPGVRMVIAGTLYTAFNVLKTVQWFHLLRQYWWYYLQMSIIIYLKYFLRYWGLSYMPATKMAFLLNLAPFIMAIFSYFAFKHVLTKKQWIGLLIGFIGFIPILLVSSKQEILFGEFFYISFPELAIMCAVVIHCYGMILTQRVVRDYKHPIALTNGIRALGGGLMALTTSYLIETQPVLQPDVFAFWVVALVCISDIACHSYYVHLTKRFSVTFLSFTDFLGPIFTAIYSWFLFNDRVDWHYFVSVAVVFAGLLLFYQDELQDYKKQPAK